MENNSFLKKKTKKRKEKQLQLQNNNNLKKEFRKLREKKERWMLH